MPFLGSVGYVDLVILKTTLENLNFKFAKKRTFLTADFPKCGKKSAGISLQVRFVYVVFLSRLITMGSREI